VRIQRLSSALAARGHDVRVFTYHLGEDAHDDRVEICRIPRVPTYNKYSPGPSLQKLLIVDPLLAAKLFVALARGSVDIVHAHHYEGLIAAWLARVGRRIPLVYDAHTLLGSELPFFKLGAPKKAVARVGARLDRWLPQLADHVVSVTQTIKDKLIAYGIDGDDITVITNGVEHEMFAAGGTAPRSPQEPPLLIFTGNLASYQGIGHLLEAFAKVAAKREDVRLLLVTESSFAPYETRAAELGIRARIDLKAAPFSAHPALLAAAAVAVNPRLNADGIPQKLLNYMAAGRPTISFAGSAPCIEHGKTGWIVENGDIDAFAGGILKLLDEPELASRLGRQARETVVASYTWDIAAAKCEALYRRLVGGGSVVGASFARDSSIVGASFARDSSIVGASFARDLRTRIASEARSYRRSSVVATIRDCAPFLGAEDRGGDAFVRPPSAIGASIGEPLKRAAAPRFRARGERQGRRFVDEEMVVGQCACRTARRRAQPNLDAGEALPARFRFTSLRLRLRRPLLRPPPVSRGSQ